ncbi:hypothetical protein OIDMADRAFT_51010 [Oidiodendron maius Zn]|uniref:F-box domain-containing protein n=1 Tax=Oidiodendron maius (strain Zn) TaxID=913774 RepID=A0A0C3D1T2_OIDMZ|nr:hypothetical protein OIDMADRAFT_51010 [Oidiodendron maius Zn]
MTNWSILLVEIRLIIFELVREDCHFNSDPYGRAGYASVCREWLPVFEQRNFRRLTLDQERISGLEQFMRTERRRDYLEHLFLCIRLDEYDCTICQSLEDDETTRK